MRVRAPTVATPWLFRTAPSATAMPPIQASMKPPSATTPPVTGDMRVLSRVVRVSVTSASALRKAMNCRGCGGR